MFPFGSQLHYLRRLTHGTTSLARQVAFCYTVDKRLTCSMTNKCTPGSLIKRQLRRDIFFDEDILIRHQGKFRNAFYLFFGENIDYSLEYASRPQSDIEYYHSSVYSLNKRTASYRISVHHVYCISQLCCGEIVFLFSHHEEHVFLLKPFKCSYRNFSSLVSYAPLQVPRRFNPTIGSTRIRSDFM